MRHPIGERHLAGEDKRDPTRVCLLCDLGDDLALEEETMPLVPSLLDQIYTCAGR